ncbi:MAG TPA: dihydrolipoamide acetyltransferase family protein [Anaerolineales bacterium]|nr:dihydrolipoamide acetyltransferase family protein [Anaerolineales bacterium]
MAVKIVMPKLGMAMTEGVVVKWLKEDGASVRKEEPIATVMSKKITYQVVASADGILRHAAQIKETRPVGAAIAYILALGEELPAEAAAPSPAVVAAPQAAAPAPATVAAKEEKPFVLASPAARRLALEKGIELMEVKGTGTGGRITEKDVLAFVETRQALPPTRPPGAPPQAIPFIGMRQAVAQRMTESLQTMAQVTLLTEADVTEMVRMRERFKQRFDLTYTDIIVMAVATALKEHPLLNAALVGEEIQLLSEIHIGVAVALEDGLIVPVVRDADKKSLQDIAEETRRLAEGARAGSLTVDEVTGSTFTITNLGTYEVDGFTPIINPPEAAILGVGRIAEKPAVYRDEIAKRAMMALSLTFDHRLVDGAPAAAFLRRVKDSLEMPSLIFAW